MPKLIIITGSRKGIGRYLSEYYLNKGMVVCGFSRRDSDLNHENYHHYNADVSDEKLVGKLIRSIKKEFGKVDYLINNAGIGRFPGDGQNGEIHETNDEAWKGVIGVNLDGAFYVSREAVRLMLEKDISGSIVNISSTSAYTGEGPLAYCTSKGALLGFTRALAVDLSPKKIRVNAICPGPTATPMLESIPQEWQDSLATSIPLGRLAEPEDVAKTSLFLVSDDASFYTGQTLSPSGGSYMI